MRPLRPRNWFWILFIFLAIGTVWLRLSIVRKSYKVDQIERRITNARQELEDLELSVARLRSPRRLEELARKKFDLQPPRSDQVVRLPKE